MKRNNHDFGVIQGNHVNFREVSVDDARFILDLRQTERAVRHLHATPPELERQVDYLKRYLTLDFEWYVLITDKLMNPIGAAGAYDVRGDSVAIGRWVMKPGLPFRYAIDAKIQFDRFLINVVGAEEIRLDTRVINRGMHRLVQAFGFVETHRTDLDVFYAADKETILRGCSKMERFCRPPRA